MNDFLKTSRSPLCELPSDNDPSSLLLAGVDTLGHAKALTELMAEKMDNDDGGTSLMIGTLLGAIVHATALIDAGRKGYMNPAI